MGGAVLVFLNGDLYIDVRDEIRVEQKALHQEETQ